MKNSSIFLLPRTYKPVKSPVPKPRHCGLADPSVSVEELLEIIDYAEQTISLALSREDCTDLLAEQFELRRKVMGELVRRRIAALKAV